MSSVTGSQVKEPQALDSAARTTPIHSSITEIKLPATEGKAVRNVHPVTLQPLTIDDLRANNIEHLMRQYPTQEAAQKEIEVAAKELKNILDENARKIQQIEHEMDEKEKTMEIERKVYSNYNKKSKDG